MDSYGKTTAVLPPSGEVEAPSKPVKIPRRAETYRASRRNSAKLRRKRFGGTIRQNMDNGAYFPPHQPRNYVAFQPIYYQKYSKTSAKVFRGGNVSGSVRRFFAKNSPDVAIRAAWEIYRETKVRG